MAVVTVSPEEFELLNEFDPAEIGRICAEVADAVGIPADYPVRINIDEAVIMGRASARIEDGTVVVDATGGAFESLRKARVFDPNRGRAVLGHSMQRVADRLNPAFGDAPPDDELTTQQESAWSTYIEGRLARKGVLEPRMQRRIYHFRVRHGFSDGVDEAFHRLWNSDGLTWSDIEALSAAAATTRAPA